MASLKVYILFDIILGHDGWVTSIQVGKTKEGKPLLISGGQDKNIFIWELDLEEYGILGKQIITLLGHTDCISSLFLSSDSQKLISGSWDRTVLVWDISTYSTQCILTGHTKGVLTVGLSHDEQVIITGSMDKTLRYWNNQGQLKHLNPSFEGWVTSMTNIKRGEECSMAVGCMDGDVQIFDNEYSLIRTIEGEKQGVTSLSVTKEGDFLFIAYKNNIIKLFQLASNKDEKDQEKIKIKSNSNIHTINFESKLFYILACGTSNGLQLLDIKGQKWMSLHKEVKSPCFSLCYDESKQFLFAGHADGKIRVHKINLDL